MEKKKSLPTFPFPQPRPRSITFSPIGSAAEPTRPHAPTGGPMKRRAPLLGTRLPQSCPANLEVNTRAWARGPADPAGILLDVSDRPLLCSAVNNSGNECVLGSSDHALYTVDLSSNRVTRVLYSKKGGHSEWVTSVSYTVGGAMLSGGMDGSLCLWRSGPVATNKRDAPVSFSPTAQEFGAHPGSISRIKCDMGGLALTAGYSARGELKIWSLQPTSMCCRAELVPTCRDATPAMDMDWDLQGTIAVGHRSGQMRSWDLQAETLLNQWKGHGGHVTCLTGNDYIYSGGQDGYVNMWDLRVNPTHPCARNASHRDKRGYGSVGDVFVHGDQLISYGSDKRIAIVDARRAGQVIQLGIHRDFIYSMALARGLNGEALLFSGDGAGVVACHDLSSLKLLFGMGCSSEGAVRCINVAAERLITAGDDGNALLHVMLGS